METEEFNDFLRLKAKMPNSFLIAFYLTGTPNYISGEICCRENQTAGVASGEEVEPNDSRSQIRRHS